MWPFNPSAKGLKKFREINIKEDFGINPFQIPPDSKALYEHFIRDEQLRFFPEVKLLKRDDVSAADFLRIISALNRRGDKLNFSIVFA